MYRARDTRLDRTVALKVLPARFGTKSGLRERFEREARVVANLSHPNICALYDVGHDNGVAFFVMEYIEGQSLADRIAKGPLPLEGAACRDRHRRRAGQGPSQRHREVQPVAPVALERMIARCLEKDPDKRWQCAGDLVAELRAIDAGTTDAAITTPKRASPLPGTASAVGPFWSPDGRSLGFFAEGKLQAIDVATGAVRTICNVAAGATFAGTWSPDGTIVFAVLAADGAIYAVPANGGQPKQLPKDPKLYGYHFPQFLGDGKRFLFSGLDVASATLYAGPTDGSPPRRLQSETARVAYVRRISFTSTTARSSRSASMKSGNRRARLLADRRVRACSRGANPGRVSLGTAYNLIRISPDGRQVAVSLVDRNSGVNALWTLDTNRKTLTRASFDKIDHDAPAWSPDGRQIVFTSDVGGPPHLYVHDLATGRNEVLLPVSEIQLPHSWIDDGRIFYQEIRLDTGSDIRTVTPRDRKPQVWLATPNNETEPKVSRPQMGRLHLRRFGRMGDLRRADRSPARSGAADHRRRQQDSLERRPARALLPPRSAGNVRAADRRGR